MTSHHLPRKQLRILHVEDSDTDAYAVERALSKDVDCDYTLRRVQSMGEAEQVLADPAQKWDLILLDLELPDSSGRKDTYMRINAAKRDDDIPVLILTGVNDQILAVNLVDDGAEDFVRKSLICMNPETLSSSINFAICRHKNWNTLRARHEKEMVEKQQVIQWMTGGYQA